MARNKDNNLNQRILFGTILIIAAGLIIGFLIRQLRSSDSNLTVQFSTSSAATVPTLSLSPASTTVGVNGNFAVNVIVDTAGSSTDGVDLKSINFNPAVLQVLDDDTNVSGVQISSTPIFSSPVVNYNVVDNTAGTILYSQISLGVNGQPGQPFVGTTTVATIHFHPIATGTSAVSFVYAAGNTTDTNMAFQGNDILAAVVNANYTVDMTAPTVSISAPANNATVSGSTVAVSANAADAGGSALVGVQFKVDGANIGAEDTSTPYAITWNTLGGVTNGAHVLTAVARDGAGNTTTSANINITVNNPTFDFSLTNGGNKSVQQGVSTTNTVTATLTSGTTAAVNFTASGLPTGASASFAPTSCSPTCTTTMTINTTASTPVAASTITVTGTSGSITHTSTFTLTVTAIPFDFSLTNGGNKSVVQGSSTTNTVTSTLTSGSAASLTYSASGLPTGASASFAPTSCSPTCTTTMTLNTTGSTPVATSTITVTATGGSVSHTSTFSLTVSAPFDFSMTNGGNKSVVQGSSTTNTVTATLVSGSASSVSFSASGLPANASASFAPTSCSPTCTTTVTLNTAASTPAGTSTVTVTATGAVTHTTTFTLTVTAANRLPQGNLDDINYASLIRGWTFDPDSSNTSLQVQVYMDGPVGTGALISTATANVDRPDIRNTYSITGNHGYEVAVPAAYQNSTPHSVYVYAIDTSSGSLTTLLAGSSKIFTTRTITIDPEGLPTKVMSGTLTVLDSGKSVLRTIPFTTNASGQTVIVLDLPAQTVYFKIGGTPYLTRLVSGINLSQSGASAVVFPKLLTGDLNQDGIINSVDYSILNTNWFTSATLPDINKDGIVNSIDFSYLNQHWLMTGEQ